MSEPRFTDPKYFSKYPWMEYIFIVTVCLGQIITQSGTNNAITHMYQLQKSFHAEEVMTPWYLASYGLAIGTLILVSGRIGDAYGIKNALIGGYSWTFVWSILTGISYYDRHAGPQFYIVCRAFQGAGVAFILPNAIGAAGRVYTPGTLRKKIVFGCIGLCAPLGGWLGLTFSGVIAVRTERWDWNYYAMAIFSFVSIILILISVPYIPAHLSDDGKRQSIDWIGALLVTASLTLFNFVWNQAPIDGWGKAYIIVLLAVSVPMFGVFVWWEIKMAENPLLPAIFLENTKILIVLFIVFIGWGAFGVNVLHYGVLMEKFRKESPFVTGVGISPALVTGTIAALSCSVIISHKTVELILLGSMLSFLVSSIVLATAGIHESYWRNTFGLWIVAPFGMDWSFPAATIMLSEELPAKFQGLAGSLVTIMVNYGSSIFLGFAGTVESQLLEQRPDDEWRAWRGALYFNIGIAGLGASCALLLALVKLFSHIRPEDREYTSSTSSNSEIEKEATEKLDTTLPDTTVHKPLNESDTVSELSVE